MARTKLCQSEAVEAWKEQEAVEKACLVQKAQLDDLRNRLTQLRNQLQFRNQNFERGSVLKTRASERTAILREELAAAGAIAGRRQQEGTERSAIHQHAAAEADAQRAAVRHAAEELHAALWDALGDKAAQLLGGHSNVADLAAALEALATAELVGESAVGDCTLSSSFKTANGTHNAMVPRAPGDLQSATRLAAMETAGHLGVRKINVSQLRREVERGQSGGSSASSATVSRTPSKMARFPSVHELISERAAKPEAAISEEKGNDPLLVDPLVAASETRKDTVIFPSAHEVAVDTADLPLPSCEAATDTEDLGSALVYSASTTSRTEHRTDFTDFTLAEGRAGVRTSASPGASTETFRQGPAHSAYDKQEDSAAAPCRAGAGSDPQTQDRHNMSEVCQLSVPTAGCAPTAAVAAAVALPTTILRTTRHLHSPLPSLSRSLSPSPSRSPSCWVKVDTLSSQGLRPQPTCQRHAPTTVGSAAPSRPHAAGASPALVAASPAGHAVQLVWAVGAQPGVAVAAGYPKAARYELFVARG